jgi:hypothetical protein
MALASPRLLVTSDTAMAQKDRPVGLPLDLMLLANSLRRRTDAENQPA